MPDHVLSDSHGEVVLAVVDHEAEADKVGHNSARARLCEDWRVVLERLLQRRERSDVRAWKLDWSYWGKARAED